MSFVSNQPQPPHRQRGPMTEERRKIRELKISTSMIATGTGMSWGTVENHFTGASKSRSGRQRIVDFLDFSLWGIVPSRRRGSAALQEAWTAERLRLRDPATPPADQRRARAAVARAQGAFQRRMEALEADPAMAMIEKITVAVERAEHMASQRSAATDPDDAAALERLIESVRHEAANAAMEEILARNPTPLAARWRAVFGIPHPSEEAKA